MADFNGYELSRKWFDFCFENPDKIRPNHTAMYFFAIEHCNRLGWKQKFGFPTTMVMEAISIKSYNTYIKTLLELVEFGFVAMVERSKNQHSSNIIELSNFNKATNKALDKALMKHTSKQHESTCQSIDSIIKQLNKEQLNNKQLDFLQNIIDNNKNEKLPTEQTEIFKKILSYFPEKLIKDNWIKVYNDLIKIDKYSENEILNIVIKFRSDEFWSKNFMSLNKLRNKNKDGIKFV